jgi:hypothetical protein
MFLKDLHHTSSFKHAHPSREDVQIRRKEELILLKRETNSFVSPKDVSLLVSFSEERIEENDPWKRYHLYPGRKQKKDKTNKKIKLKKTHNILTHNLQDDEIKTAVSG